MRLIIIQILIALTLISVSECRKNTINKAYNEIFEEPRKKEHAILFNERMKDFDKNCIKNYLNISENGRLVVDNTEQIIISTAAILKCSKNQDEYIKYLLNIEFAGQRNNDIDCVKRALQKLDPTSILIQNFTSNLNETEIKKCKNKIPDFTATDKKLQRDIGGLNFFTCGAITKAEELFTIAFKVVLLVLDELDSIVKETETNKIIEISKPLILATADCIMNRINNNRTGK